MAEPLYKTFRNKKTGNVVDAISDDGGKTWRVDGQATTPSDTELSASVEDRQPGQPPPSDAPGQAVGAQDPTDFDPNQLGATGGSPADIAQRELDAMPEPQVAEPGPPKTTPLSAFAQWLPQPYSFSLSDEMEGIGAAERFRDEQMTGGAYGRTKGRGIDAPLMTPQEQEQASYEDAQGRRQAELDKAAEDQPGAAIAAQVLGGIHATAPLAAFGMPAGMLGRMGVGGAEGVALGAAEGAASAKPGERAEGAVRGGLIGGPLGVLGGALPIKGTADYAGDLASRKRLTSTGPTAEDYEELLQRGINKPAEVGQAIEDVGLTRGATTTGYMNQADQMRKEAGKEIESIVADIQSVPQPTPGMPTPADGKRAVTVDFTPVAMNIDEAATELAKLPIPEAAKMSADLQKRAQMLATDGFSDYKTAWQTRVYLDDLAHDATGQGQKNTPVAKRLRQIAGDLQAQLEAAVSRDRPELLEPLREANKRYSTATKVFDYSSGDVARRATTKPTAGQVLASIATAGAVPAYQLVGDRAVSSLARGTQQGLAAFPGGMGYLGAQMMPEDLELEE